MTEEELLRYRKALGQRIREARVARGMTQTQVAGGFSKGFVSAIELGYTWPSLPALLLLAANLRCSVDHLLPGRVIHD